ncbi:Glutathione synthase/RimK-type ligase, ATP-grasp superfamily [Actinokineospora alba]|uniref:Glutathione synthase/RimK-type ligase, ATP-grasp superfamily n=1 Tax=Actinokineospora alba TaxID=504798 RepID=A0A1H0URA8_9PSEU|nr:Glutathione synthase/RimK-type ligase, ATP-grasp superfamily [Actinokineospora alba]
MLFHVGMDSSVLVLMTDHSSREGSRKVLSRAAERLTGNPPVSIDARHFFPGGSGKVTAVDGGLQLEVPAENLVVRPSALVIYEIPPEKRRGFEAAQRQLHAFGAASLGTDVEAWRVATEKDLSVERFTRDGIAQMETISVTADANPAAVFERLGRDVWARPVVGMGGNDVFHVTTDEQLHAATRYYGESGLGWLMARDANNFTPDGVRQQFRVVVLDGRVVYACEHVQAQPDAPCNETRGAVSTRLSLDELPPELHQLAVSATKSLGLNLGGVDLALVNGGVVFEVNVHPAFNTSIPIEESFATPYIEAHLALR